MSIPALARSMRTLVLVLLAAAVTAAATPRAGAQPGLSSPNIETHRLTSRIFGNTRSIRVLLPPGYRDESNAGMRYPVLYLNDGIMAFRPQALGLEETVHRLIRADSIRPVIVVGIDNGASTDKTTNALRDRANEFLPYPDGGFAGSSYEPVPPDPAGKSYPEFVFDEVRPLIEQRYRVEEGPAGTMVGGFSYGAVAALYTAVTRPGRVGGLLLESVPLWIGPGGELMRDARAAPSWPARVYVASGSKESPDAAVLREGQRLTDSLLASIRVRSPSTRIEYFIAPDGTHDPAAWRARLARGLVFLFAR
jgi:enterochelin esterase-like enzyme